MANIFFAPYGSRGAAMGFITLPRVQLRFLDPATHMKFMHIWRVLGKHISRFFPIISTNVGRHIISSQSHFSYIRTFIKSRSPDPLSSPPNGTIWTHFSSIFPTRVGDQILKPGKWVPGSIYF